MGLIYIKVNPLRMARVLASGEFFVFGNNEVIRFVVSEPPSVIACI